MILYWYIHWFWITITINIYGTCYDTSKNNSILFTTTTIKVDVHNTISSRPQNTTKSIENNTEQMKKLISVIEPNISSNSIDNLTLSDNLTISVSVPGSNNESLLTISERVRNVKSSDSDSGDLTAASITGITLGCISLVGLITAISFFLYRNRNFNRPQVLSDRCSTLDSSGYIDDTSVRDNSEEMYSLDNDSFLNSLEAMTIQNYWTDTVKHTKL